MKALTDEILEKNGFSTNHPDFALKKYKMHCDNPEWNISIEKEYIPLTNVLGYNLCCWKANEKGVITKRVQTSILQTVEEVNDALKLCGIDVEVKD